MFTKRVDFNTLLGKTFTEVYLNHHEHELVLKGINVHFVQNHSQSCCESVGIKEIVGDLNDLVDSPIIEAEEVISNYLEASESGTSSWYKLGTVKGFVTITWVGESNGWYSETVDLYDINKSISHVTG